MGSRVDSPEEISIFNTLFGSEEFKKKTCSEKICDIGGLVVTCPCLTCGWLIMGLANENSPIGWVCPFLCNCLCFPCLYLEKLRKNNNEMSVNL